MYVLLSALLAGIVVWISASGAVRIGTTDDAGSPARIFLPIAEQRLARKVDYISPTPVTHTPTAWPSTTPLGLTETPTVGTASPTRTASGTADPRTPTAERQTVTVTPTSDGMPTVTPTGGTQTSPPPTPSPTRTLVPTPDFGGRDVEQVAVRPLSADLTAAGTIEWDPVLRTYRITAAGESGRRYEIEMGHPDITRGRLAIRDVESGRYPMAGSGLMYRDGEGEVLEPRLFRAGWPVTDVAHGVLSNTLTLTVTEELEGVSHRKRYRITPLGGALRIQAESLDGARDAAGAYAGFSSGDIEGWSQATAVRIPYAGMVPMTLVDGGLFIGTVLDYPGSQSNELYPRGPTSGPGSFSHETVAAYLPDADGRVRAVDEVVWLTVSERVSDLFPVPAGVPRSPHWARLVARPLIAVSRAPDADFQEVEGALDELATWGIDDPVLRLEGWTDPQALPPSVFPADAAAGGASGVARIAGATGLLVADGAYTATISGCPARPNPAWRPGDAPRGADGDPKTLPAPFICPDGVEVPRLQLGAESAERVAGDDAGLLASLGVQGMALADLARWNPGWGLPGADENVVDLGVPPSQPATVGQAIRANMRLFDRISRDLGPVIAVGDVGPWEARYDSLYAGWLDGATLPLSTGVLDGASPGEDQPIMPDYALTVMRRRLMGWGVGSYESFFIVAVPPLTASQLDAYRATTLSYGHGGAVERVVGARFPWLSRADQVREAYLWRALQPEVSTVGDASVSYVAADGTEQSLSEALVGGSDLVGPRLRIRMGGASVGIWVNHGDSPWEVEVRGRTLVLPTDGWAVDSPSVFAFSAEIDGRRADFLESRAYTMLDGRGRPVDFGSAVARDLRILFPDGRELVEDPDGSLRWIQ